MFSQWNRVIRVTSFIQAFRGRECCGKSVVHRTMTVTVYRRAICGSTSYELQRSLEEFSTALIIHSYALISSYWGAGRQPLVPPKTSLIWGAKSFWPSSSTNLWMLSSFPARPHRPAALRNVSQHEDAVLRVLPKQWRHNCLCFCLLSGLTSWPPGHTLVPCFFPKSRLDKHMGLEPSC